MIAIDGDRVNRQLQRIAGERHGRDTQALQVLYAIEGDAAALRTTLQAVAEHRRHPILPLAEALAGLPDWQRSYDALRRRASFSLAPPVRWADLIADVVAFVDPLIQDDADPPATWDPAAREWT